MSAISHRTVKRWSALALLTIVVLAAGVGQTSAGHTILQNAGLFEKPASYTSLSFQNPQPLPEQLDSQRSNISISFAIHNTGDGPQGYRWSILLVQGALTRPVGAGSVRLASGRGAAVTRTVQIFCTQGQVRIVVSLARPEESIDAWTTCRSPKS
jgi:hypothetical protein